MVNACGAQARQALMASSKSGAPAFPTSAPKPGCGIANPVGTILSVAMMLRTSFGLAAEAAAIERATSDALARGIATADLSGPSEAVGTEAMARAVAETVGSFLIADHVIT